MKLFVVSLALVAAMGMGPAWAAEQPELTQAELEQILEEIAEAVDDLERLEGRAPKLWETATTAEVSTPTPH